MLKELSEKCADEDGMLSLERLYAAHRLAWLYVHGEFPLSNMDHRDGNGKNNAIANLSLATPLKNSKNQRLFSNNRSGITGVAYRKSKRKWIAYIKSDYEHYHLGTFDNIFDAACARKSAEHKFDFHENHGSIRPL